MGSCLEKAVGKSFLEGGQVLKLIQSAQESYDSTARVEIEPAPQCQPSQPPRGQPQVQTPDSSPPIRHPLGPRLFGRFGFFRYILVGN